MKPQKTLYALLMFLMGWTVVHAQNAVDYLYDATGNRISRTMEVGGGTQKSLSIYDTTHQALKEEAKTLKSLEEQVGKTIVNVYPNPNRGEMVVQVQNLPLDVPSSVKVYDAEESLQYIFLIFTLLFLFKGGRNKTEPDAQFAGQQFQAHQ